jgi:predicted nucleic acid-binding protein
MNARSVGSMLRVLGDLFAQFFMVRMVPRPGNRSSLVTSVTLVACEALVAELRDVASRPFFRARLRASAAELLAAGVQDFSFFCRELPSGPVAPDPKDRHLLALAEASQAEFLVTGDKRLLSLKRHKSTRIITPASMIELLKEAESSE